MNRIDNINSHSSYLVSVIMPLYNAKNTVAGSVKSVLSQTHENFELIIVNDCSTDISYEIVKALANSDDRIKLLQLAHNSGAGIARNAAINKAKGEYIAFLDADDRWLPQKLDIQLEIFDKYDVPLVCSGYQIIRNNNIKVGSKQPDEWITLSNLLKSNVIGCLTAIYSVKKVGKMFMPSIRKRQDYALWLDIIRQHGPAYCVQQELAQYYVQTGSISSNKLEMFKCNYRMFRETQGYSKTISALLTLRNAAFKILKY